MPLRRAAPATGPLPMPPETMRSATGPTDEAAYENPEGKLVFGDQYPAEQYRAFFDFGCGCGRVARQLALQQTPPERYVGVDLNKAMIRWCQRNLTPRTPAFEFRHHPVENPSFNPRGRRLVAGFGVEDGAFTLVNAWSVFTHLRERQVDHYLAEVARILAPGGVFQSTWFLVDRALFPMLHPAEHALYSNDRDPTQAVLYDRDWIRERVRVAGLAVTSITPPVVRGFQWILRMVPAGPGVEEVELPEDTAAVGWAPLRPPPE